MPEKDEVGKQAAAVVILAVGMPEEDVVGRPSSHSYLRSGYGLSPPQPEPSNHPTFRHVRLGILSFCGLRPPRPEPPRLPLVRVRLL